MNEAKVLKTFYSMGETMQRLGLDDDAFRQAIQFELQDPENGNWIRAIARTDPHKHFLAVLSGALEQQPSISPQLPAILGTGELFPVRGSSKFGSWDMCGSTRRTGYSAVYELRGAFVISPESLRMAAEGWTDHWSIDAVVAVAPVEMTDKSHYPDVEFCIVYSESPNSCRVVSLEQACFLASDVDRVCGSRAPAPIQVLNHKWPWGDHETDLLQHLAAAAKEFWSTYDPDDQSTAPKNADVVAWLVGRGVAKRTAEIIATLLRPENIRTGPR